MKKNFCVTVSGLDGVPFKDGDKDVFLKKICVDALNAPEMEHGQPRKLSCEEHQSRYALAKKLYTSEGEIEVTAEEVALLKHAISMTYITSVVGPSIELLEGN